MNIISNLSGSIILLSIVLLSDYCIRKILYRPNVEKIQKCFTIVFISLASLMGISRIILAINTKQSLICCLLILLMTIVSNVFIWLKGNNNTITLVQSNIVTDNRFITLLRRNKCCSIVIEICIMIATMVLVGWSFTNLGLPIMK